MLEFRTLLLFALAYASSAVSAERWQDRANNGRMKTRLDLDGFQRDGDLLTYRVEITFPDDPKRSGQRVISTSVIDCLANKRKHVAIETHLSDGTVRRGVGAGHWLKLRDWEFAAGVRNEYCFEAK